MSRFLVCMLMMFIVCGCSYPLRQRVDDLICNSPVSVDIAPRTAGADKEVAGAWTDGKRIDASSDLLQASYQGKVDEQKKSMTDRILDKGVGIPGWDAPRITLNPKDKDYQKELERVAKEHFPPLPALDPEVAPAPSPEGRPYTLADLQRLARTNSPLLRQAGANLEAAKGAAIQAGAYPNPTISFSSNTVGPSGGPVWGPNASQVIKTGGKLALLQAAAEKDLAMSELAFRRAETNLTYSIRTSYFAVLVAQESITANRAVAVLTGEMYNIMTQQLKAGEVTPYEPAQLGVFAQQARQNLVQARNSYTLAWKQLACSLGLPAMPPTAVEGSVRMPLPQYKHEDVLALVLANHTDARTANENIAKARYSLRTAEVTPVPDVNAQIGGWYDDSQGGNARWVTAFTIGATVPLWDQNKGAIRQAKGNLLMNIEEPHRVRNVLTASVADAYRRYDENRVLLKMFKDDILPKQVLAFRGALIRHEKEGGAAYWDVISAEQNLVTVVGNYLPVLGNMWQAVVDVAHLTQTDDLFQASGLPDASAVPDLEAMLQCCHPCSILPDPRLKTFDPRWPHAGADVMKAVPTLAPPTVPPAPAPDGKQSMTPPVNPRMILLPAVTPAVETPPAPSVLGPAVSVEDPNVVPLPNN